MGRPPGKRRERGVALLTAIILVALATIVATAIAWQASLSARRAAAVFTMAQSFAIAEAAEGMAGYTLRDNRQKNPQLVAPNQDWAIPFGPTEITPGVVLEAFLEDESGKFNLNSVVMAAAGPGVPGSTATGAPATRPAGPAGLGAPAPAPATSGVLVRNPTGVAQFEALLQSLDLDISYAARLVDWIDSDDQPIFPGGGEDSLYLAQEPAHRVSNLPLTSISELLAMGMERASYDKLAPYVTALPAATRLNICTAPGLVLDAVAGGQRAYAIDAKEMALQRQHNPCYPDMAGYMSGLGTAQKAGLNIGTTSSYFRLRTWITIGTTRFTLYSLLEQDPSGQTRPIFRTFGTE
ncbi:MAG TPA: type II secretion system minor pseudopilin GspK [Steroidobacteraceae bacterium]|nr:type II secretion system minor pseudopilin GspK [Steroidobacteraceae bacterium]